MKIFRNLLYRLRGDTSTETLIAQGMQVGKNFRRMAGVILDNSHSWLITIGDNVTMAPRAHILCHDASTKKLLGYTRIGRVTIGNDVFIGAEAVVLPGVTIGDRVIIGANSTVTRDIPGNSVAVGSPARVICTLDEFLQKEKTRMEAAPVYDESYTLRGSITDEKKARQREDLSGGKIGYVD